MTNTEVLSAELEVLKSIDAKSIKAAQRYAHFGRIAELEAKLAVALKLEKLRRSKTI